MRLLVITLILSVLPILQADILYLRDGSRQHGELISQDRNEVVFRIMLADGQSSMVQTYPAALVVRVERTGKRDVPPAEEVVPSADAALQADVAGTLRDGFTQLDAGDLRAALRDIQHAVLRAPPPVLEQLETICRQTRGADLADLLAGLRIRLAAEKGKQGAFKLRYATPYEQSALGLQLEAYQKALLAERFAGRTIAEWVTAHDDSLTLRPDAPRMVATISRAAGVLAARLKYDPRLETDREQRRQLLRLQADLSRLAARVLALPGFTSLGPETASGGMPEPIPPPTIPGLDRGQIPASQSTTAPAEEAGAASREPELR